MEAIGSGFSDTVWRRTLAVMAGALLLFYMLCPVAPARWNDLYLSYGRVALISLAAIYFFRARLRGRLETKLVVWYAIWIFLSRLLNTDLYLQNELELVLSRVLCAVVLPLGMLLEEKERRVLLDVVIAAAGAYYFVAALLGLYAAIFGVYFYIPPEHVVFGYDDNSVFYANFIYLIAWETNRTISAVWFYLAWCMMVYEFFRCENRLWRVPIVLAMFVFHLAIAFCQCRSIKLAFSVNVAMLLVLGGLRLLKTRSNAVKALLLGLVALASLPLSYKSFDALTFCSAKIYDAMDVQIERTSDAFMGEAYQERTQDGQSFSDDRDLKASISNLSNRGEIYRSVLPTLRDDPLILLRGRYSMKIMDLPRQYLSYPYYHMHNFLLQVLMLAGLPGLALVAAFCLLLAFKSVRVFFSELPTAVKTLTLPLFGVLFYGLFETVIFTASADERALTDFRELFFFLLAGILLGYAYELPARRT